MIISTELNSNLHQTIQKHSHYELELKLLTDEQRSLYIDAFFHSFNKVSFDFTNTLSFHFMYV